MAKTPKSISGLTSAAAARVMLWQSGEEVTVPGNAMGLVTAESMSTFMGFPAGVSVDYWGTAAPSGSRFCNGQALSRTTFSALFAIIGTTYGVGDGTTTFNVPDCRGRVMAGQDDMGGSSANRLTGLSGGVDGDVLGATGGAESHQLTVAQMPAHTHDWNRDQLIASAGVLSGATYNWTPTATATSSTGGDGVHNNVQPTIICNKLITTGGVV